ncbi:MAG: flavin reductase [Atopobiaceae bacterium]|jgi:flavin reductase (DIM6/NTAB) family NADH-FMN oxidoreductase RutF/rubredoxin|nr:flavin reductase [Atopobiaceae bacterium]MCH4181505.1 flavin reductase [Atopobiaceae bacterium]MCH4215151.1 flavin reductase [Atopobiaceae bacterium]MCH4230563.1 flavin reductase [Atopobiaceae bacterium]MCH4275903.1 flavin reductase [Atopobiaceae bacterium]
MDKTAFFKFSYGVYVVSADDGEHVGACLVNTGCQLTSDPYQVMVCVNKENFTASVIQNAGHFALTVLSEKATMDYVGTFGFKSSETVDKYDGLEVDTSTLFDPYCPQNACAVMSCAVVNTLDVGTHIVFVGEVCEAKVLSNDKPMTYDYYHTVLRGKTPPKASAYVEGADASEQPAAATAGGALHHFRCTVCGYVYETPDEELPADFTCPLCGVGPDKFEKVD